MKLNKRLVLLACLISFVVICQSLPTDPQQSSTPQSDGNLPADGSLDTMESGDDGEDYGDDGEEYDYAYEYGDGDDEEEELEELIEEQGEVKADCAYLKAMIQKAQQNTTGTVDPDLQDAYKGCQQYLEEITADIQELSADIQGV